MDVADGAVVAVIVSFSLKMYEKLGFQFLDCNYTHKYDNPSGVN
jgi:hypothetical protein